MKQQGEIQTKYFLFGIIALLNTLVPLYIFATNVQFIVRSLNILQAVVFGIMAYGAFKKTAWMRKWAVVTGLYSLFDGIMAIYFGRFSLGSFVIAVVFFYFARGGGSEVIYNKQEFSKNSLRNFFLLFLGIVLIIGGVYLYFQFILNSQPSHSQSGSRYFDYLKN